MIKCHYYLGKWFSSIDLRGCYMVVYKDTPEESINALVKLIPCEIVRLENHIEGNIKFTKDWLVKEYKQTIEKLKHFFHENSLGDNSIVKTSYNNGN